MAENQGSVKKGAKNVEKSAEKIWKFHFFAVTLQPLSRLKMLLATAPEQGQRGKNEVLKNFFEKKFPKNLVD